VTKEGLKFGDEDEDLEKKRAQLYKENFKPLTDYLKQLYGDAVVKVAVSKRIESTPTIIVTSQYGNSANMERIMRAQAFSEKQNMGAFPCCSRRGARRAAAARDASARPGLRPLAWRRRLGARRGGAPSYDREGTLRARRHDAVPEDDGDQPAAPDHRCFK